MKKFFITVGILLALAVIGYVSFRVIRSRQQANAISSLQTVKVTRGDLTATVGATGTVRANQTALIAWQTSGTVDNVYAEVGQEITAGQTLADLSLTSLPQNLILAQSDLISARDALKNLTNPDLATISNAERALSAAYTNYQQAQNNLTNAIITNKDANEVNKYNDWFTTKTALDLARNALPLANAPIDIQAYYQAVHNTSQLQVELTLEKGMASNHPEDALLAKKVTDMEAAVQESLTKQNNLEVGLTSDTIGSIKTLSDSLSAYETSTDGFIATVVTDTLNTNIDLAQIQADMAQKQSDLLHMQTTLDDLTNQRQNMNGKRCDDATIADYQDAYDAALNAYNFTGHIPNSR